jgi:hypothetical protein
MAITGVAWMMDQEESKLSGGVVRDDSRVGKTILTLGHIYFQSLQLIANLKTDSTVELRGTLVACPSGVSDGWFQEWEKISSKSLNGSYTRAWWTLQTPNAIPTCSWLRGRRPKTRLNTSDRTISPIQNDPPASS